ncbi:hypothetical protein MMC06_002650 [Schaereria dolodes]|nr:hypothetical protein [Schaereria dolodes]
MLFFISPPKSPFEPPSLQYWIISSPLNFVAYSIHHLLVYLRGPPLLPTPETSRISIVCISDTHTLVPNSVPPGDILIHAGDLTNLGTASEIQAHISWLSSLPHTHKIVVAGNHDSFLDPRSRYASDSHNSLDWGDIHYLQHSSVILTFPNNRRLNIYGAPQTPECGGPEFAFQYPRGEDAWSGTLPPETDVLVTHTPPRHHLDLPAGLGCALLLKEVWRVRPKLHVFGHVHAGVGRESVFWDEAQRAYERVCARRPCGILRDIIAVKAWLDLLRVLWYGSLGIVWSKVWCAEAGGGIMVNAALMYLNTGELRNKPQVVDL